MKNITKISMIVFIIVFCLQSNAQTFGLKAGLNLSSMHEKDDTYSYDYKINTGFHIGATFDIPLNGFLSFEPGWFLSTKGMNYDEIISGMNFKVRTNLYYIDFPLSLKVFHDFGDGLKMYGSVGPYIGVGIAGKLNLTYGYKGRINNLDKSLYYGNAKEDLKRFDMGLAFGGGIEINFITIGISYEHGLSNTGLSNILVNEDDGVKITNRVLKFSLGYRFGINWF